MATCPHCGYKLRLTDWKPDCPECGVNLNYYKANDRLLDESEKAEAEHAKFQPKIDRAKAAYAGNWKTILRIVFTLLPIGALFLPLATLSGNHNVIDVYKYISAADIGAMVTGGSAFSYSILLLLLSAAMILVCLISVVASLGKHGKGRTVALYGVMLLAAAGSLVLFLSAAKSPELTARYGDAAAGPGAYLYTALQAFSFAWNFMLLSKGIPVTYTPCIIGGLPSEEYFGYLEAGWTRGEIRRKMLVALAKQQADREEAAQKEAAEA